MSTETVPLLLTQIEQRSVSIWYKLTEFLDEAKVSRLYPSKKREAKNNLHNNWSQILVKFAVPVLGAQILEYSLILVSAVSLGHISTEALAASSLSSITATVTGLSVVHGFASALDSLLPQAWTSDQPEKVGLWAQRMVIVMAINALPIVAIWLNAESILLRLGQEEKIAHLAGIYLGWFTLSLPGLIIGVVTRFVGAPIASSISFTLSAAIYVGYTYLLVSRKAWHPIGRQTFQGLGTLYRLGLSGTGQIASEWWSWEFLGLMSSRFGATSLAAQSVLLVSASVAFQTPYSLGVSVAVRVGNLLGSGDGRRAKVAAETAIGMSIITALAMSTIIMVFRLGAMVNITAYYCIVSDRNLKIGDAEYVVDLLTIRLAMISDSDKRLSTSYDMQSGQHTLVLRNGGTGDITYAFTHVPAGTINTISGIQADLGPIDLDNVAAVTIEPIEVTVPAGSSASVNITINPPTNLNASQFPIYSGYIRAIGSDNSTLQSTYIGVAARLKDMKVIDNTDAYFGDIQLPVIMDALGNPVPPNGSATFSLNASDTPIVIFRLATGSALIRFDLVDSRANTTTNQHRSKQPAVERSSVYTALLKRSAWNWLFYNRVQTTGTFGAIPTLGVLYQDRYVPRNSAANTTVNGGYYVIPINRFVNGTDIPNGRYRILFRALKITGDPDQEEDYETWTSPTAVVRRA
ncbi:unnamed protein product [Rhizoctonia solani]|uniref:C5a peptidase/Subtilisin-like protease SBT2-like Fn3-like domain-containing protein n=1 Tax=Rhizoctonia solani TaxID=456999 RepID=A0A8H3D832_9AGAM|nr:unnamed protein product [Rhizoctonia solani]